MAKINTLNYQTVASWNGSQDLFVVEQPDGTKVATPAQIKQYVLGNSIDDIYSVMGYMGAKNLLVPEWTEAHTTENGVTYTFNADGTIIMNTDASGATANTNCNLRQNTVSTNNVFPAGSYTFTGCPAGGSSTKYRTWLRAYRPNTNTALTDNLYEEGNGVSFTVSEPFSLGINATVRSGYVCNNLTWKPMLRLASDTDETYQPYAKTNRQLTEEIGDLSQTGLTGDSVAAQLGDASGQIGSLKTPTLIWEGSATDVGTTYNMTGNYTDFKYLLVSAKTNVEVKNILIPTSSISAANIYSDVLSAGTWNATDKAFAYNSSYGIKFTAANAFQLASLSYNNANWVLRPRAIYGIG